MRILSIVCLEFLVGVSLSIAPAFAQNPYDLSGNVYRILGLPETVESEDIIEARLADLQKQHASDLVALEILKHASISAQMWSGFITIQDRDHKIPILPLQKTVNPTAPYERGVDLETIFYKILPDDEMRVNYLIAAWSDPIEDFSDYLNTLNQTDLSARDLTTEIFLSIHGSPKMLFNPRLPSLLHAFALKISGETGQSVPDFYRQIFREIVFAPRGWNGFFKNHYAQPNLGSLAAVLIESIMRLPDAVARTLLEDLRDFAESRYQIARLAGATSLIPIPSNPEKEVFYRSLRYWIKEKLEEIAHGSQGQVVSKARPCRYFLLDF